ncbi:MAG: hypothetical protein KAV87_49565 [Desulfobacteraceae bacterium]|nr:hypothetical protein [Desulfobacteraceae bacterium]
MGFTLTKESFSEILQRSSVSRVSFVDGMSSMRDIVMEYIRNENYELDLDDYKSVNAFRDHLELRVSQVEQALVKKPGS